MRETIRRLGQQKTILLSTHILQEVEAVASRVLFISEGRLKFDGTPAELTRDGHTLDEQFHGRHDCLREFRRNRATRLCILHLSIFILHLNSSP